MRRGRGTGEKRGEKNAKEMVIEGKGDKHILIRACGSDVDVARQEELVTCGYGEMS